MNAYHLYLNKLRNICASKSCSLKRKAFAAQDGCNLSTSWLLKTHFLESSVLTKPGGHIFNKQHHDTVDG